MLIQLALASLAFTLGTHAVADEQAYIRTSSIRQMEKLSQGHVSGRLTDLDVDDEGPAILCYAGDPDEVCDLIKTAVREENEREKYDSEHAWRMRECGFDESKSWWPGLGGYVEFRVTRKPGETEDRNFRNTITDHMPLCSKLEKIK